MQAFAYTRPPAVGQLAQELQLIDCPQPVPGTQQLLVRMHASCINIDDIHIAEGTFFGGMYRSRASIDQPAIPGVDVAGTVAGLGAQVKGVAIGDPVLGFLMPQAGSGSWAEYCCLDAMLSVPIPDGYTWQEAAACGIGGKTAADAVCAARRSSGQTCVVVGATGGIGSIIVQVLACQGVRVVAVCSGTNAALAASLGADTVVDYTRGPFSSQLPQMSIDAVIDCVGGRDTERQARTVLGAAGRFVTLCGPEQYVGESRLGRTGVARMMAYVVWRTLWSRIRGPRYVLGGMGRSLAPLRDLVLANGIRPPIDRIVPFGLTAMRDASAHVRSHSARGKVVIAITDDETDG